jgi:hypothetical protein
MSDALFPMPQDAVRPEMETIPVQPRLVTPDRAQVQLEPVHVDRLVPEDHSARAVWAFLKGLDPGPLYAQFGRRRGKRGVQRRIHEC